jgi:predicted MFS family arabinose efflux permease
MMYAVILTFPGVYLPAPRRAAAMGVLTTVAALGVAVGPPLGGMITGTLGWRWVFFVNVPIGVAALAAAAAWLPRRHVASADRHLDTPGMAFSLLAILLLILCLNEGREWGWGSAPTILTLAASLGSAFAFVLREQRTAHPLLDLRLFRHRRFSLAAAAFLIAMASTSGVLFLFPFYLQDQRGLAPLAAGTVLMVIAAGQLIGPLAGKLADCFGTRPMCCAGLILSAAAFGIFCLLSDVSPLWLVVLSLGLFGLSLGIGKAPNITLAIEDVPLTHKPLAGSVISVARSLGLAMGVVWFGAVFSDAIPHSVSIDNVSLHAARIDPALLQRGFTAAFLLGVAISLLALLLVVLAGPQRAPADDAPVERAPA